MSYRVAVKKQVMDFAGCLAPEPRRALRKGILGLEQERGDIKALTDDLTGWYRLRIGRYRVVFRFGSRSAPVSGAGVGVPPTPQKPSARRQGQPAGRRRSPEDFSPARSQPSRSKLRGIGPSADAPRRV